ncbi:MAG: tetratricopeptide repeat protein, partial [Deltaproteobacteria bacterium]
AKKGQYDKAISDCKKAIEINPRFVLAYNNRGFAYSEGKGQYDKAISDFDKAIEINPRFAPAYNNRGFVYMVRLENKKKACSDWKRACELGMCKNYVLAKRKGYCQ